MKIYVWGALDSEQKRKGPFFMDAAGGSGIAIAIADGIERARELVLEYSERCDWACWTSSQNTTEELIRQLNDIMPEVYEIGEHGFFLDGSNY